MYIIYVSLVSCLKLNVQVHKCIHEKISVLKNKIDKVMMHDACWATYPPKIRQSRLVYGKIRKKA